MRIQSKYAEQGFTAYIQYSMLLSTQFSELQWGRLLGILCSFLSMSLSFLL
uniref:Uncharacterized protein n=1 Tax=Anguilla anguilla TaxID=7936 RepID=A0A0E9SXC4_ANGAN